MATLQRLKVLITRPKHQAKKLGHDIQACDGIAIFFPTLEIVPSDNVESLSEIFKQIDQYDFVIFISPNAVLESITYVRRFYHSWPKKTKIIAIGPGTANTLEAHALVVSYCPAKNFSSEGLLELPVLKNPVQKKILICQGENADLPLVNLLKKRKALISIANLYQRQCPQLDKKHVPKLHDVDIIICTSNTGLKNLVNLLQTYWDEALLNKQLLVISSRIADFAKKLGFVKTPLISDNASSEAILQTLKIYAKRKFEHKTKT